MGIRHFRDVDLKSGLQSLNLTGNLISDFEGFDPQYVSGLQILVMDQNPILSFKGFPEDCPELEWLSMIDCPIASLPNFRAIAVAVVGPKLKVLNGDPVTEKDKALALTYGVRETVFPLLAKGWIPCKPVSFSSKALWDRLMGEINDQEKDPWSLRACRLLKTLGWSIHEMRAFVKRYYEGGPAEVKKEEEKKEEDTLEAQVERQQEIIGVLATQLQALKSGNHLFNRYKNVVRAVAGDLIANDKYLDIINGGGFVDERDDASEHYEELRAAVIDFLHADEYDSDQELIAKLNELMIEEEDQGEKLSESSSESSKKGDKKLEEESDKKAEEEEKSEKKVEEEEKSEKKAEEEEKKSGDESENSESSKRSRKSRKSRHSESDRSSQHEGDDGSATGEGFRKKKRRRSRRSESESEHGSRKSRKFRKSDAESASDVKPADDNESTSGAASPEKGEEDKAEHE